MKTPAARFPLLLSAMIIVLTTFPLSSCAMSNTERAQYELRRMKAERYFADELQAKFVTAIGRGDVAQAELLLAKGAAVNQEGKEGMTPLFWAMSKQNFEGFSFLLSKGANANVITSWINERGTEQSASALDMGATMEDARYLRALLEHGGDPNQEMDSSAQTPIYTAILHQRLANVDLLLQKGADINHRTAKSKKTPISYAVSTRHYALALHLLQAGADPSIETSWGSSAVDTTKKFGDRGVVIGSEDEAAYTKFVAELKCRGFWKD